MDRWVGIVAVTSDRDVNKENAHSAWAGNPSNAQRTDPDLMSYTRRYYNQ